MERTRATLARRLSYLTLASGIIVANADTPDHPYKVISVRNAFDLLPPSAPPEVKPPEQAKVDKLKFVGISKIGGVRRAHIVAPIPAGGYFYYDLEEGVTRDGITVLQIDEASETVKISNAGTELTLTEKDSFTSPKIAGVPTLPTPPGAPPPGSPGSPTARPLHIPTPTSPGSANATATSAGPTIVSRNSGANTSSATPLPGAGYNPAASMNAGRVADANAPSSLRSIPTRSVRTVPTPQSNLSPEEQVVMMEAQRMKAAQSGIPMPPTPGLP
jgi:hypothetical protein